MGTYVLPCTLKPEQPINFTYCRTGLKPGWGAVGSGGRDEGEGDTAGGGDTDRYVTEET